MHWLLIMYVYTYGFSYIPVMEKFETEAQCEFVAKHVHDAHGMYKDVECLELPTH